MQGAALKKLGEKSENIQAGFEVSTTLPLTSGVWVWWIHPHTTRNFGVEGKPTLERPGGSWRAVRLNGAYVARDVVITG